MKRRSFLALLGLLPVAIKAVVANPPEPKKLPLGRWMSDGTGSCNFDPLNYEGEIQWINADQFQKEIVERIARSNPYADLFRQNTFKT